MHLSIQAVRLGWIEYNIVLTPQRHDGIVRSNAFSVLKKILSSVVGHIGRSLCTCIMKTVDSQRKIT